MRKVHTNPSTGLDELDGALGGLRPGDNVVWKVDSIDDYIDLVHPFCSEATAKDRPLVYFRFADHREVVPAPAAAETHRIRPEAGFEPFISQIFDVIERNGIGACYVFDSLSELAVDWYSDRMLANFFMLTCPYLYTYETLTYFALMRNRNTAIAIEAIHDTAQIVIDVYRRDNSRYIHPLKVYKRHSDTMYTLHAWEADRFTPVRSSATIASVMTSVPRPVLGLSMGTRDVWARTFCEAQALAGSDQAAAAPSSSASRELMLRLLRMAITREPRLLNLAQEYLTIEDLVEVGTRMIGTGLVGGKSVGMLVARAALRRANALWAERLEAHDSFYIGADVFYTYLVVNGCWWVRRRLRDPALALDSAQEARQRIQGGTFPNDIKDQFADMLDYFGQSPIIVRSSSLLEDAYGNAFSGKYESVFCANQGTPEQRLEQFMIAVRTVYASTMGPEAIQYRIRWGLLDSDEQMAVLVQRVSGQPYGRFFYPQIAGVGFSYNPFVWSEGIDPHAGFLRLVFGLGTRAVERSDDDYTRIVALNAPHLRPEGNLDEVREHAQRRVDVLDMGNNRHESRYFHDIAGEAEGLPVHLFASREGELSPGVLTFDELLGGSGFVDTMRDMLQQLERAYCHPVDVEFTANFTDNNTFTVNLVQCRPFQVRGRTADVRVPRGVAEGNILIKTAGPIVGNSLSARVDRLIYVDPAAYSDLKQEEKYALARLIGRLTHLQGDLKADTIVLVGPGRWGTTTPSLGVPVDLADINTVSVLCECALMHEGLVPDLSLGTHFFNDIVELDMLYMAIYPERQGSVLNRYYFEAAPNSLGELLPDAAGWAHVVKVTAPPAGVDGRGICLDADAYHQEALCYLDAPTHRGGGRRKEKRK